MNVGGVRYRTIWVGRDRASIEVIDQTKLPHAFEIVSLRSAAELAAAIARMVVRGAPLIGAAGAYGVWLAAREDPGDAAIERAGARLASARPTAVNLRWAVERMTKALLPLAAGARAGAALELANAIADEDVRMNEAIGRHGAELIEAVARRAANGEPVRVLTHCNAGWLATVDFGTALAPVYLAHDRKIPVHVWVDETRPRNQGALTAWELGEHGVPHTFIVDNAGGQLMRRGLVDLCIVGTDRTTSTGDVVNKIGTYLKALAAHDNGVPFYVAAPSPSIDWSAADGLADVPIEERDGDEVRRVAGPCEAGCESAARPALAGEHDVRAGAHAVRVVPRSTQVHNPGFDVTPARLVTALITERGVCAASAEGLRGLFPEKGWP